MKIRDNGPDPPFCDCDTFYSEFVRAIPAASLS